jgi:hypothetical protein
MLDLLFIGLTLLFWGITLGLLTLCDRLMEEKP